MSLRGKDGGVWVTVRGRQYFLVTHTVLRESVAGLRRLDIDETHWFLRELWDSPQHGPRLRQTFGAHFSIASHELVWVFAAPAPRLPPAREPVVALSDLAAEPEGAPELHWVGIKVRLDDGTPLRGVTCCIEQPHGAVVTRASDDAGAARVADMPAEGMCTITFPGLEEHLESLRTA